MPKGICKFNKLRPLINPKVAITKEGNEELLAYLYKLRFFCIKFLLPCGVREGVDAIV